MLKYLQNEIKVGGKGQYVQTARFLPTFSCAPAKRAEDCRMSWSCTGKGKKWWIRADGRRRWWNGDGLVVWQHCAAQGSNIMGNLVCSEEIQWAKSSWQIFFICHWVGSSALGDKNGWKVDWIVLCAGVRLWQGAQRSDRRMGEQNDCYM